MIAIVVILIMIKVIAIIGDDHMMIDQHWNDDLSYS